jgi:hypothetical protein
MSDWQPVVNLLVGVPVALLTSWLTVKFALRRFQSEKWFERRVDAYTKVIEALHFMKHCTERQLRAAERGADIPKEIENELVSSYRKGLADLRKLTDMGALLFSPEAVAVLDTLNAELLAATDEQSWWEHLDAEAAAISKCLVNLRGIAKRDLNA